MSLNLKHVSGTILCICLILISGCERRMYPKAIAVEGYLHTPWGKFKFKNISQETADKMNLYDSQKLYRSYLVADAGNVIVVYGTSTRYNFRVYGKSDVYGDRYHLKINNQKTKITINNEIKTVFSKNVNSKIKTTGFHENKTITFGSWFWYAAICTIE